MNIQYTDANKYAKLLMGTELRISREKQNWLNKKELSDIKKTNELKIERNDIDDIEDAIEDDIERGEDINEMSDLLNDPIDNMMDINNSKRDDIEDDIDENDSFAEISDEEIDIYNKISDPDTLDVNEKIDSFNEKLLNIQMI